MLLFDVIMQNSLKEWELVVIWLALPTMGVLTSVQRAWITKFLHCYLKLGHFKTRAIAVLLAPNRACDMTGKVGQEDEDGVKSEAGSSDDSQDEAADSKEISEKDSAIKEGFNKILSKPRR